MLDASDMGRETLDAIYAKLFGAEAALVRRGLVRCGGLNRLI